MTMRLKEGCVYLEGGRSKEGYRTWNVKHLVLSDAPIGPATALTCPGLPLPTEMYLFDDDIDVWAFCTLEAKVSPAESVNKHKNYWIEQVFTTEPMIKWCKDQQIEDPLLQPAKLSGNFIRYTEEATYDRFGQLLLTSSWEKISGPETEFDADRIQIEIEQNVINLNLPLLIALSNTVNAFPLWGAAERMIKFTPGPWSMNFYGLCHKYFTRKLIFEAKKDGWDRNVLDEGNRVLAGDWDTDITKEAKYHLRLINGKPANPNNPAHFIRYRDREGNYGRTVLDGAGKPFIPNLVTFIPDGDCGKGVQSANKWLVNGIINYNLLFDNVILEYQGNCVWLAEWDVDFEDTREVRLVFLPQGVLPTAQWWLTIEGVVNSIWIIQHTEWSPLGPNTLTNRGGRVNIGLLPQDLTMFPASITLTTGNFPGVRHIEKYDSADFLPLGIPLIL